MSAWKPILAALVIFAAGVMTGGLTVKLRQRDPPRLAIQQLRKLGAGPREAQLRELSRRMQNELDLTSEQRGHIEAIVRDSQSRMRTVWEEVGPRIRDEFRQMRLRIRAELNGEQRKRFEEIMKQHDERNKRSESNGHSSAPTAEKPE